MKYKITNNANSITLLILPVIFYGTDYLYKKYGTGDKPYNFATGIIQADYKTDIVPMLQEAVKNLNIVCQKRLGVDPVILANLFGEKTNDNFPLFTWDVDKDGNQTKNIAVSCRNSSTAEDKKYLFEDVAETKPVDESTAYRNQYAIELEIKAYYNEKTETNNIFATFHRGIVCGVRDLDASFTKNDKAWEGFELDDLPF